MNQIWVIMCLAALAYGVMSGQIETMNQVLIEVGQDTFDFVVPVIMMTCFFSGIMEVAKACGLLKGLQKLMQPFLARLFPDVPSNNPALQYIGANIVINMFGLGFAATPSGLKAMEHLQDLNPDKKTASRPMVTFLVLNTAGVTLISTNIIAYRQACGSLMSTQYIPYAILSTLMASIAGLLLDRWWNYRKS